VRSWSQSTWQVADWAVQWYAAVTMASHRLHCIAVQCWQFCRPLALLLQTLAASSLEGKNAGVEAPIAR
jgi:hypothetical protein